MKKNSALLLLFVPILLLMAFNPQRELTTKTFQSTLYDSIVTMDKLWEDAYNNCKMDVMEDIISEDLEFYHDQGGLLTSKQKLNEALQQNICGKVNRILMQGSLEVYPIKGYGAVEMGMHAFYNSKEKIPNDLHYAKFVHIWKREKSKWRITRVISLH
ncbi:MAG: nuclear transport factor 2 family protein [Chryseotalea sp.]|jgi:hypothetical protein|nr:nuclear transport factor 2 family protein [Flammeovirgaceae bacterium]